MKCAISHTGTAHGLSLLFATKYILSCFQAEATSSVQKYLFDSYLFRGPNFASFLYNILLFQDEKALLVPEVFEFANVF